MTSDAPVKSLFKVPNQPPGKGENRKPGLFESITSLLSSKQPETIADLEKKVEPAEEIQRAVEEAKQAAAPSKPHKPLFGLVGTVIPEKVEYDLFTDGPFSVDYPDWPRLKELPESCVVAVTNGVFTIELSVEEMEPLTFATYMKKIISGVEEQLNAKILQKRVLLDSAYLEFVLVRDNKLWLYKAKIVECNRRFYTVSINGPKKEFPAVKPVVDHVLSSVIVYRSGKPANVRIEDIRDLNEAERESIEAQIKEVETELAEMELQGGYTIQAEAKALNELIPIDASRLPAKKPFKGKNPPIVSPKPAPSPLPVAKPKSTPAEKPVTRSQALVQEPPLAVPASLPLYESPEMKHLEEELSTLEKEHAQLPPEAATEAQAEAKPEPPLAKVLPAKALKTKASKPLPVAPAQLASPAARALPPAQREKLEKKLAMLDEALELGVISMKSYKAGRAEILALLAR